ncbi:MAG: hypothetical protein LBI14_10155 [Treponema sp.]|nr:hypothetical protein [Treponema sp.]
MHSTLIRVEIAYATNSPDYDWGGFNTKNRFYVFANLGADIPIWSGSFSNEKYGLSITLPFMIDVWLDRFELKTSPVINTDYRFGAFDFSFIYRLDHQISVLPSFNIYNWALKLSLFKHESTHIGDELTIFRKKEDMPITRVDVAYNFAELIFTLNDPDGQARLNHGFKVGLLFDYGMKGGWYNPLISEAEEGTINPNRFPFEFYIQYQFQSALFSHGFQIIASAEYRLRERYKYPFSYSGSMSDFYKESHLVNCFNFFAGIRFDNQKSNYFSKIGIGIRYYLGINPYGQFRSMPHYNQFGLAVLFE